jgi:hypothetical protein
MQTCVVGRVRSSLDQQSAAAGLFLLPAASCEEQQHDSNRFSAELLIDRRNCTGFSEESNKEIHR